MGQRDSGNETRRGSAGCSGAPGAAAAPTPCDRTVFGAVDSVAAWGAGARRACRTATSTGSAGCSPCACGGSRSDAWSCSTQPDPRVGESFEAHASRCAARSDSIGTETAFAGGRGRCAESSAVDGNPGCAEAIGAEFTKHTFSASSAYDTARCTGRAAIAVSTATSSGQIESGGSAASAACGSSSRGYSGEIASAPGCSRCSSSAASGNADASVEPGAGSSDLHRSGASGPADQSRSGWASGTRWIYSRRIQSGAGRSGRAGRI